MDYKKYNDYELIYMIGENSEDSKELLVNKYKPIITSLASKYYNRYGNGGYQYEDFYQEAIFAFYRAISTYDSNKGALFYTYAVVCMNRTLLAFSRVIHNDAMKSLVDTNVDLDEISYSIEDPEANLEFIYNNMEREDYVKDIIFSIPFEVSPIVELRYNGFTYREIGILLDIPISTVDYKLRRVRKRLRSVNRQY